MHLVTPEGIAARKEWYREADLLSSSLLRLMVDGVARFPSDIFDHFGERDRDIVSEAMWILIDQGFLSFTELRMLKLSSVDGNLKA